MNILGSKMNSKANTIAFANPPFLGHPVGWPIAMQLES